MAERFVSPGVFTRENDLSFLPQGIAEIGGAFIGPTVKGPAFVPTIVESAEEYRSKFGNPIPEFYAPHAAIDYLDDAARATIVRVLGLGGYPPTQTGPVLVQAVSGSETVTFGLLLPSRNTLAVTPVAIVTATLGPTSGTTDFGITITDANAESSSFTALTVVEISSSFWVDAFGQGAGGAEKAFVALNFPRSTALFGGGVTGSSWTMSLQSGSAGENAYTFTGTDYSNASTPFIQSQTIGGKKHNLFKLSTFSDGNASNAEIKVSITSTRPAAAGATDKHGQFSIAIRAFADTDAKQTIVEQFDNLSINPDSSNYFARRIGDTRSTVNTSGELVNTGDYPANSKLVFIEVAAGIETVPDAALPAGFQQLRSPINIVDIPSASYVSTRFEIPTGGTEAVENTRRFYGYDFNDTTNKTFLNPIPSGAALIGSAFSLEDLTGDDAAVATAVTASTVAGASLRRFTVPLQGGFDGLNPSRVLASEGDITATNTQGFDLQLSTTSGSAAFKRAIDIIADPESFDINLIVLPGVLRELHPFVTQLTIDMCEDRGDCFYIMDNVGFGSNVATAINTIATVDTSFAGVYHPWVKIFDVNSNKNIWTPPSVSIPQVYAFNDKVAAEWFAPAGLNRGGITSAVQVEKRLTKANRDDLYEGRVNPIAIFPGTGIVAFGQKTLQVKPSALDRISVRRLLIAVKKFIASSSRFLVFEQNIESTRQRFLNIANPFLASIQERSGLFAFKVIMDESNNTADLIDRNVLVGQIFLQPSRTAEFISLEFNILPTGAVFPEGA